MRVLAALSVSVVMLAGCGNTCSNDVLSSVLYTSGGLRAVVFTRECGATVGPNTQISVVAATEQPNEAGNVVVLKGTVPLRLRWQSETELIVTGAAATDQSKRELVVGTVTIHYE